MSALRALVAVPHDNEARRLARFLGERGCEVLLAERGDRALEMVRSARGRASPIELLLADHRLHALDGLSLIREVHVVEPSAVGCLLIDTHRIDDALRAEAHRLGCRHVLGIPIDFGKLQGIVERLHRQHGVGTGTRTRSQTPGDESPFFGTRRLTPGTGRVSVGTGRHQQPEPTPSEGSGVFDAALQPPTDEGRAAQSPSHLYRAMEGTRPDTRRRSLAGTPTTGRHNEPTSQRRPPVTGAFDEPHASPTQRIRRAVTGRIDRQQQDDQVRQATDRISRSSAKVACAHCGQPFAVVRKPESYTMPCIHCGGINTVNP